MTIPSVLIESEDALGVAQPGSGYVESKLYLSGPCKCVECKRDVIVAFHENRPDGTHPVLLEPKKISGGPWRLYAKKHEPEKLLTVFIGEDEPEGYVNHRLSCPGGYV
jgi:hypothetical protein